MRLLLIASTAWLAACAATPDLPEPSRELRDYQPFEPAEKVQPIALEQTPQPVAGRVGISIVPCTVAGEPAECFAGIETVACTVDGQPMRCHTGDTGEPAAAFPDEQMALLEQFAHAAHANTRALWAVLEENAALRRELAHLLAAGRATERQAEIYREMYLAEARQANLTRLAAGGAAGLILLVLSAGAL